MTDYIPLQGDAWETSKLAYANLLGSLRKTRLQVATEVARYTYIDGWDGLTDAEVDDICGKRYGKMHDRSYARRRTDLYYMGLIKWTGDRRLPKTRDDGTNAMNVWRIVTPEELAVLVDESGCSHVAEYIDKASKEIMKKKKKPPTVDEISDLIFELRTYPPVYVAKKIQELYTRSCI